jgi:hypothetical protein
MIARRFIRMSVPPVSYVATGGRKSSGMRTDSVKAPRRTQIEKQRITALFPYASQAPTPELCATAVPPDWFDFPGLPVHRGPRYSQTADQRVDGFAARGRLPALPDLGVDVARSACSRSLSIHNKSP